jgi:hypothetical protein
VLYLAFQALVVVDWGAVSGLCHYIAVGQQIKLSLVLFNDILLHNPF